MLIGDQVERRSGGVEAWRRRRRRRRDGGDDGPNRWERGCMRTACEPAIVHCVRSRAEPGPVCSFGSRLHAGYGGLVDRS